MHPSYPSSSEFSALAAQWHNMVPISSVIRHFISNFRDAMAAPAALAEFQGNVATVLAEKYWDRELTAAKMKENDIKQRAKTLAAEGKMKPSEEKLLQEKMRMEGLSERERQVMEKGISNLEFHYLGSAKILGGIGKGLAESMAELKQLKKIQ